MTTFLRTDKAEIIRKETIERVYLLPAEAEAVPPKPLRVAVRHTSGAVDEYAMNSKTGKRLVRWFEGDTSVIDLVEE